MRLPDESKIGTIMHSVTVTHASDLPFCMVSQYMPCFKMYYQIYYFSVSVPECLFYLDIQRHPHLQNSGFSVEVKMV